MKMFSPAFLKCLLSALLCLSSASVAMASYTATATTTQTTYKPGRVNTFSFSVTVTTNGTAEFVDLIKFSFPAGCTVASTVGPSPFTACGGGQGNAVIAANVASWETPAHPSGCGAFDTGTYTFTVVVNVPISQKGPMNVVA